MEYTVLNEEVLYTTEVLTRIDTNDLKLLKSMALKNARKRVRLCAHPNIYDTLHEMIIIHPEGAYVRPHKHMGKSESFHIIEGCLKVVIFDDDGTIRKTFTMADASSGEVFFYRIADSLFHTIIPQSPFVVFHETTNGPFKRHDSVFAPWSPDENDYGAVEKYMHKLSELIYREKSDISIY